jgi:hypothetical protein
MYRPVAAKVWVGGLVWLKMRVIWFGFTCYEVLFWAMQDAGIWFGYVGFAKVCYGSVDAGVWFLTL